MSMAHYMVYMSAVILMVCSLTFLLSSCTEEMLDGLQKPYTGPMIAVQFKFGGVSNPDNEMVTRNAEASPNPSKGVTTPNPSKGGELSSPFGGDGGGDDAFVIPVADDLFMHTTIEVNRDVRLRGTNPLDFGTELRIVAYRDGTEYHTHKDYTIDNNHELAGDLFQVAPGNYRFVAYSYNTMPLPTHHNETISDIDPAIDLLWGRFPADNNLYEITVSSTDELPITLAHLFSQVRLMITTTDIPDNLAITNIQNVSITPNQKANLNIKDGTFTEGSATVQGFSSWSGINTTTVISGFRTAYTHGSNKTHVVIGSMTLGGSRTFTNQTAIFDKKLEGGISYTLKIAFKRDGTTITDSEPLLDFNTLMYVGAFWRADQTGERLIRIQRPPSQPFTDGPWTARVIVGTDWIVLDREMTKDPNVGWLSGANEAQVKNGNDPGFDDMYPVNSTLTAVNGVWNADEPYIYFRIGLKSKYQPTPNKPARYGMILLTYHDNLRTHRIWIRQGEGADYVFSNNDPISVPVYGVNSRTVTRRFSPYNLTADKLNAPVDIRGTGSNGNPGKPTAYPSQAGAFFVWGYHSAPRWGYNPYPQASINWYGGYSQSYWSAISQDHETCPPGYRRPNDGKINAAETGQVSPAGVNHLSISEMRQSLLMQPKIGFNERNDDQNSTWGYYADGFFDRRAMTSVNAYEHFPQRPTTVSYNNDHIAHVGQLFFNPIERSDHYAASLFFPATGFRNVSGGALQNYGHYGWYMTSSAYAPDLGIIFRVRARYDTPRDIDLWSVEIWRGDKRTGAAIRCVVDES